MKPLVAAALASWILMAPPIDTGWSAKINPAMPLSQWFVVNRYDSPQECNLVRDWRILGAMRALDNAKDEVKRVRRHRLLIWAYLWECDPSDDPRLRER
jgi:hypothetical protein